jgi:hypothetical protein
MATTTNKSLTLLDEGQRDKTTTLNANAQLLDKFGFLGSFPLAGSPTTIPDATTHPNAIAIITGVDGSPLVDYLCYSDGTNWRKIAQVLDNVVV